MSENLPYHDEQWDDLPLPNEEEAWQKMQHLLEEKERRRRFLPLWFWRYGLLGILVAGLATGGYFFLAKNGKTPTETTSTNAAVPPERKDQQKPTQREPEKNKVSLPGDKGTSAANKTPHENSHQPLAINRGNPGLEKQRSPKASTDKVDGSFNSYSSQKKNNVWVDVARVVEQKKHEREKTFDQTSQDSISEEKAQVSQPQPQAQTADTPSADSTATRDSTEPVIETPVDSSETQKQAPKKKSLIVFSAGVGLQQAIAFGGQQTSNYTLAGKQNKFSDHLPSVYLRLQKGRWFLQGEMHYQVPQPVKPFSFSQVSSYDGASNTINTERLSVQKLYYHQVPVSINYTIVPQWSLGAGVVYNRFAGAVTGQETQHKNVVTGTESMTRQVVPVKGYKDSFLYKSTTGFLLQTDYHWGRFSLGLRYTASLQPFIKYTQPDGAVLNEKNQVLQAILRFRLFER
ncbi:hypothetical protein HRH25_16055 [Flavisolibacter sp. BT320]|nr:hypothetical protein [Flavisolibacter longurius]